MENIKERIAEIYESAKLNYPNNPISVEDYHKASYYEYGDVAYYKKRVYELSQLIYKNPIGRTWIEIFDRPNNIFENGVVEKIVKDALIHIDEKQVWEKLEIFTELYLFFIDYEDYIKEEEAPKLKAKPIIGIEILILIYKKYKEYFDESQDEWVNRFIYPNNVSVDPIVIEGIRKSNSNKLVLIAILSVVQTCTGNEFDFNKFARERFGIKAYNKTKSEQKEKREFEEVCKECNRILKFCSYNI